MAAAAVKRREPMSDFTATRTPILPPKRPRSFDSLISDRVHSGCWPGAPQASLRLVRRLMKNVNPSHSADCS